MIINDSSFHLVPYIRLKILVISHNVKQVCEKLYSRFAKMFKLLKKFFFQILGNVFFYPIQQQNYGVKKNIHRYLLLL